MEPANRACYIAATTPSLRGALPIKQMPVVWRVRLTQEELSNSFYSMGKLRFPCCMIAVLLNNHRPACPDPPLEECRPPRCVVKLPILHEGDWHPNRRCPCVPKFADEIGASGQNISVTACDFHRDFLAHHAPSFESPMSGLRNL